MDEVGFVVDSIRPDGRLVLGLKGGAFTWLWEAQPALLHTPGQADLPAVFEPRAHYQQATKSASAAALTVFAGFTSAQQAQAAGIRVGRTTVTMPANARSAQMKLRRGTYKFQLRAVNAVGHSSLSARSNIVRAR